MGKSEQAEKLDEWTGQEWQTEDGSQSVQGPKASGKVYLPKATIAALKATRAGRQKLARADSTKKSDTAKGIQHSKHKMHEGKNRSGMA